MKKNLEDRARAKGYSSGRAYMLALTAPITLSDQPESRITEHEIAHDFRNTIGQRVFVLDCPFFNTTVAVVNSSTCTCGEAI